MNGQELKVAGQQASLFGMEKVRDDFALTLCAFGPGAYMSVNDVRDTLDFFEIPVSARGGLFAQAVRKGLLAPVTTPEGYEVRVPSTGLSAHRATCRLYVRTVAA